jgi:hypothetical protein
MKKLFVIFVMLAAINVNAQWVPFDSKNDKRVYCDGNISSETSIIIDTIALKYFPLAVGNVYKYHYAASNGYSYDYKVRIIKDSVVNSKRYFVANSYFPGSIGKVLRTDSLTANVYSRNNSYCPYSPYEELIDSLRSRKLDSTLVCSGIPKHYCSDTGSVSLFGFQVKKKTFSRSTSAAWTTVSYGMNFGIISAMYGDSYGLAGDNLLGCYINGVLYGDTTLTTNVQIISLEIPKSFILLQNYPNPFNPTTKIKFNVAKVCEVKIIVYDVAGREVQTLLNESLKPGTYETTFDGSQLTSGVYFYRMVTDEYTEARKMILIK